jgi:voltage-gated potassium channel
VRHARWLRLTLILALAAVFYFVVPVVRQPQGGLVLRTLLAIVLFGSLALAVVIQLRRSLEAGDERIDGLIIAIVLMAFMFAIAFYGMHLRKPNEIADLNTRLDALYFVISTMLTVGFGDVHATGQLARGLVVVQMIVDVIFVATAGTLITSRMRERATRRAAERVAAREEEPETGRRALRRRHGTPAP